MLPISGSGNYRYITGGGGGNTSSSGILILTIPLQPKHAFSLLVFLLCAREAVPLICSVEDRHHLDPDLTFYLDADPDPDPDPDPTPNFTHVRKSEFFVKHLFTGVPVDNILFQISILVNVIAVMVQLYIWLKWRWI
jgi:hypothetical protein